MRLILNTTFALSLLPALALAQPVRYDILDLGQVGGPPGQPFFIARNGLIAGASAAAGGVEHATLWYRGWKADFGEPGLGGANSVAFAVNNSGQAVGEAETSTSDPNQEDFCGFKAMGLPSPGNTCPPFFWQYGVMTALPTLGGPNGTANQINDSGQIAGAAETGAFDKSCPLPQLLQFKPVVWQSGKVQELPTVGGDVDGVAFAINDQGQVVGSTGACAAFNPVILVNLAPAHAVLWKNGVATDLKSLGGAFGNVALNINNLGHVVGQSDLAGDNSFDAFLWTRETGMRDLSTLPGDAVSAGLAINDSDEVVGVSLDAKFNPRAFHWQNGAMTDLNSLIRENPAGLSLALACSINARGEIIGVAFDGSGNPHGYLAVPRHADDDGEVAAPARKNIAPDRVRELIRQRLPFAALRAPLAPAQ